MVVVVVLRIRPPLLQHLFYIPQERLIGMFPVQEPLAEGLDMGSSPIWLPSPAPVRRRLEGALAQERPLRSAMSAGGGSSAQHASAAAEIDIDLS